MEKTISMDNVVGQKIKKIRTLTEEEVDTQKWDVDDYPMVIELENNVCLYVCNEDMSGPGSLWGFGLGEPFIVTV